MRGRVYRTAPMSGPIPAWRGVVSEDGGEELWRGNAHGTPDEAFDDLRTNAMALNCEDYHPWSGVWPEADHEAD